MKKEFRHRLLRLSEAINESLEYDYPTVNLFPCLFSVFTYIWCKSSDEVITLKRKKQRSAFIMRQFVD